MKVEIGSGYYAKCYLIKNVIEKHHYYEQIAQKEFEQLTLLSEYSQWIKKPESISGLVLKIPYISGKSLDQVTLNSNICSDLVNKLGGIHQNKADKFCKNGDFPVGNTWPEHYNNWLKYWFEQLKNKSNALNMKLTATQNWVFPIVEDFIVKIPSLFAPLKNDKPTLVHGDVGPFNVIIKEDKVAGFIDPFDAGFYHIEMDLIHLNNGNGELLDAYIKRWGGLKGEWQLRLAYMGFVNDIYHHWQTNWWDEEYLANRAKNIQQFTR